MNAFDSLRLDTRYGSGMLLRNPGFAIVAILTLALGIGPGTAHSGEPVQIQASLVSQNLPAMLGIRPVVGRNFEPSEVSPGHDNVVPISHALWQSVRLATGRRRPARDHRLRASVGPGASWCRYFPIFSLLAIALSGIGLYGGISGSVAQRTRELGVRRALGANTSSLIRTVLAQGARLSTIGVTAGVIVALLLPDLFRAFFRPDNHRPRSLHFRRNCPHRDRSRGKFRACVARRERGTDRGSSPRIRATPFG